MPALPCHPRVTVPQCLPSPATRMSPYLDVWPPLPPPCHRAPTDPTLIIHTCEVLKERILLKGRRVQAQFDLTPIAKRDLCGTSVTFSVLEDNGKVHGLPDCMTAPITALITAGGGL